MIKKEFWQKIVEILKSGGIIAYPTEAVFGLGCDPFNEQAVLKLLQLKKRDISKGLILIAASWEQFEPLIQPIDDSIINKIFTSWPGPNTWVVPANSRVPSWIKGKYSSVAVRVTAHPVAKKICEMFGGPIVSTSANIEGLPPAKTAEEVQGQFPEGIDLIVPGKVGNLKKPTTIRDAITDKIIR